MSANAAARPKKAGGGSRARQKVGAPDTITALREPAQLRGPSKSLVIHSDAGETKEGMLAKTVLRPTIRAAFTVAEFDADFGELDLTQLVGKLADQVRAIQVGDLGRPEEMLITHAHTMDMVFHSLLRRGIRNLNAGHGEAAESYIRLALRTQSQCRATLETLAVLKNPPVPAFIRQANIANGPQQINNGCQQNASAPDDSRANGNKPVSPNKLLETKLDERMDN